jgi:UDP-N-acetylmuramoyl-tripeptide--D-alanyl-D-alanine ligase
VISVTVQHAARVLGVTPAGRGDAGASITSLVTDSRAVRAGALFVALRGERADGHDFVAGARADGAVAALVSRPVDTGLSLIVPDPLAALGALARDQVDQGHARDLQVLAITGSQGKTSTKDVLAQILEPAGPTVSPRGNLNNELGVPLTIARIEEGTRFLVAEMGARGIGHIAYLCRIAPPDVALVLNVGVAHVGEFGGQAAIAQAKGELVEALSDQGVAILNADDRLVWEMRSRTKGRVVAFSGECEPAWDSAVWASDLVSDALGRFAFSLHASLPGEPYRRVKVELLSSGRHQVANSVAAAAAALVVGVPVADIATTLGRATPRSRWRMEMRSRADGLLVVNDAYNANPDSMRAAIETLADLGRTRSNAQTWAVLGDMLELGATSRAEHAGVGAQVARSGISRLIALGDQASVVVEAAVAAGLPSERAVLADDKSEAVRILRRDLAPSDVVLVKASRGLALDTVAEQILILDGR